MKIPLVDLKAQFHSIEGEIREKIDEVLKSCSFIQGKSVRAFEEEFAAFCGPDLYCASCGNGTDALYLTFRALEIGAGDEVIVPTNTFIGSVEGITLNRAKPVFVDIDPRTYNLDCVEEAITSKTRAILGVHLYGQPFDVERLQVIASKHSLLLIEDAAQAHGASWNGVRTGGLGHAACFSFFPGKNLGCYGDGGAVVSKDADFIRKVSKIANHGRQEKYIHEVEGVNSRLDTLQAEVLRVKLRYLSKWTELRNEKARYYLEKLRGVVDLPYVHENAYSAWHLFVIRVPNRDEMLNSLHEGGIGAGIHYPLPLHLQPAYRYLGHGEGDFPHAEKAAAEILSLPLFPELTKQQQDEVITQVVCNAKGQFVTA